MASLAHDVLEQELVPPHVAILLEKLKRHVHLVAFCLSLLDDPCQERPCYLLSALVHRAAKDRWKYLLRRLPHFCVTVDVRFQLDICLIRALREFSLRLEVVFGVVGVVHVYALAGVPQLLCEVQFDIVVWV